MRSRSRPRRHLRSSRRRGTLRRQGRLQTRVRHRNRLYPQTGNMPPRKHGSQYLRRKRMPNFHHHGKPRYWRQQNLTSSYRIKRMHSRQQDIQRSPLTPPGSQPLQNAGVTRRLLYHGQRKGRSSLITDSKSRRKPGRRLSPRPNRQLERVHRPETPRQRFHRVVDLRNSRQKSPRRHRRSQNKTDRRHNRS